MKKNPIGITMIGDPFLLKASDGKYYLYATTFKKDTPNYCGFHVWVSEDLNSFSKPLECYYQSNRSFGYMDYWAPEVVEYNGKFIMYYSARRREDDSLRIGVAISDSPMGPFNRIGTILQQDSLVAKGAGHHSVIQVPGKDEYYMVYHRRPLDKKAASEREVCIDKMEFDEKGFIKPVKITFEGVEAVEIK